MIGWNRTKVLTQTVKVNEEKERKSLQNAIRGLRQLYKKEPDNKIGELFPETASIKRAVPKKTRTRKII